MAKPYTMSGKIGNMVYQRNRYGQICYPAFIPVCPRRAVPSPYGTDGSPQVPVAYTTYLQANRLLADWSRHRHKRLALLPASG